MQRIIQLTEEEYNDLLAYKELHISAINAVIAEAKEAENLAFSIYKKNIEELSTNIWQIRYCLHNLFRLAYFECNSFWCRNMLKGVEDLLHSDIKDITKFKENIK